MGQINTMKANSKRRKEVSEKKNAARERAIQISKPEESGVNNTYKLARTK
jgi:hypothetical protein